MKRTAAKRQQPRASKEPDPGSASVLPMDIQVGDRFTDAGFKWEVLTHPTAMHGAKALRARVVRPGLPETEREVTWQAHACRHPARPEVSGLRTISWHPATWPTMRQAAKGVLRMQAQMRRRAGWS